MVLANCQPPPCREPGCATDESTPLLLVPVLLHLHYIYIYITFCGDNFPKLTAIAKLQPFHIFKEFSMLSLMLFPEHFPQEIWVHVRATCPAGLLSLVFALRRACTSHSTSYLTCTASSCWVSCDQWQSASAAAILLFMTLECRWNHPLDRMCNFSFVLPGYSQCTNK